MGEWIPEPLPDRSEWISGRPGGATADPAGRVTLDEPLSMAFLVVLESVTPAQRVAIDALIGLLDPGATVIADGGGLVSAALRPIEGGDHIARYLAGIAGRVPGSMTFLEPAGTRRRGRAS